MGEDESFSTYFLRIKMDHKEQCQQNKPIKFLQDFRQEIMRGNTELSNVEDDTFDLGRKEFLNFWFYSVSISG